MENIDVPPPPTLEPGVGPGGPADSGLNPRILAGLGVAAVAILVLLMGTPPTGEEEEEEDEPEVEDKLEPEPADVDDMKGVAEEAKKPPQLTQTERKKREKEMEKAAVEAARAKATSPKTPAYSYSNDPGAETVAAQKDITAGPKPSKPKPRIPAATDVSKMTKSEVKAVQEEVVRKKQTGGGQPDRRDFSSMTAWRKAVLEWQKASA